MSTCRSCGAEVQWGVTAQDKRMPLDVEEIFVPVGEEFPRGIFRLTGTSKGTVIVPPVDFVERKVYGSDPAGPYYTSHFATCPQADRWRHR